jgi:hypothetical protein
MVGSTTGHVIDSLLSLGFISIPALCWNQNCFLVIVPLSSLSLLLVYSSVFQTGFWEIMMTFWKCFHNYFTDFL